MMESSSFCEQSVRRPMARAWITSHDYGQAQRKSGSEAYGIVAAKTASFETAALQHSTPPTIPRT